MELARTQGTGPSGKANISFISIFLCWLIMAILPKMFFSAVNCTILSCILIFTDFFNLLKADNFHFLIGS